jgi:hypothetical protein
MREQQPRTIPVKTECFELSDGPTNFPFEAHARASIRDAGNVASSSQVADDRESQCLV